MCLRLEASIQQSCDISLESPFKRFRSATMGDSNISQLQGIESTSLCWRWEAHRESCTGDLRGCHGRHSSACETPLADHLLSFSCGYVLQSAVICSLGFRFIHSTEHAMHWSTFVLLLQVIHIVSCLYPHAVFQLWVRNSSVGRATRFRV